MKAQLSTTMRALFCVWFAAALASCGGTIPQGAPPRSNLSQQPLNARGVPTYRLVVLGNGLVPNKINNLGIIVGMDINTNHPFEYKNGHVTELALYPGDTVGGALDVNNREQIVGFTLNPEVELQNLEGPCPPTCGQTHAVLYQRGETINLGSIPGVQNWSNSADLINDAGEIVGESGYLPASGGSRQITIFAPGPVRAVNDALYGLNARGFPYGLNNAGEIVGAHFDILGTPFSYPNPITCSPPLVFLDDWFKGINNVGDTISATPSVYCKNGIGQQLQLSPTAINDGGDIVGSATAAQDETYSRGTFYKIIDTTTGPRPTSLANAVSGTKIGRYFVSSNHAVQGYVLSVSPGDALLYSKGAYYDLNDLVPNHPAIIFQNPTSINNRRDIVGTAISAGSQAVGWLLVPR